MNKEVTLLISNSLRHSWCGLFYGDLGRFFGLGRLTKHPTNLLNYGSDNYLLKQVRMETLVVQPENKEQLKAIKTFLKALKVDFKAQKEKTYQAEWEAKIKRSEDDYKAGRIKEIKTKDLWQ